MSGTIERREFLRGAFGAAALLPLTGIPSRVRAAVKTSSLSVERLTDRLLLISGGGGNVVAFAAEDGIVLVDGGSADRSADVLKTIERELGARPIHVLFNTHWHPEHVGANERLGRAGTRIVAHENTRLWLGTRVNQSWMPRVVEPLPLRARPNSTFYTTGSLEFGGEHIDYGHLGQAHTDGDIYIFFRHANVLIAGDVLAVGTYPILDYTTGGWIGGIASATQQLADLADAQTRIIPGIGPVQTRIELVAEQQMLAKSKDILWQMMRKGYSAQDMIAAGALKEFDATWGSSDLFISNAYPGMYGHVRELGGVV